MSTGWVRRAQLVSPFGVGAMSILVNGTSVITAGLDHWYATDDPSNLYPDEYIVNEWRLQERLRVKEFRLPPEHRIPRQGRSGQRNVNLAVPVLRFPTWSFCRFCKRLEPSPLSLSQPARCPDPVHRSEEGTGNHRKAPVMSQVPFVAICERGHLDDFPWSQWVHRELAPSCRGVLRLVSRGGGTLAGQVVTCSACERERPLEGVTAPTRHGEHESTVLTRQLCQEGEFPCRGSRPWVADPGSGCGFPLRAALRGAGNVYFPLVESSIFLPRRQGGARAEVLDILRRADVQPIIQLLHELLPTVTAAQIRSKVKPELLQPFSDKELDAGLAELFSSGPAPEPAPADDGDELTGSAEWRRPEYNILRTSLEHPDLKVNDPGVPPDLATTVAAVRRIEVLRETRVLRGFTRVRHESLRLSEGKALLRRQPLPPNQDWLPAYVVRGEGIYLELHPTALARWEANPEVQARAGRMAARFGPVQQARGLRHSDVSARFVLLHTLAHLLINELVYTCGYSSAALRERLYVSTKPSHEMAGMLIYTAAGDSEGTMGGLVRMGQPHNLSPVVTAAIAKARWCSTDPVCMELGEAGQGPNSCNMAACHGCALVPETSCEEFNHFLDRGLVTGTFDRPNLGYFSSMLEAASQPAGRRAVQISQRSTSA